MIATGQSVNDSSVINKNEAIFDNFNTYPNKVVDICSLMYIKMKI